MHTSDTLCSCSLFSYLFADVYNTVIELDCDIIPRLILRKGDIGHFSAKFCNNYVISKLKLVPFKFSDARARECWQAKIPFATGGLD